MKKVILRTPESFITIGDLCDKGILGIIAYKRKKSVKPSSSHALLAKLEIGWGFVDMFGYSIDPTYTAASAGDSIEKALKGGVVVEQYHDLEEFID